MMGGYLEGSANSSRAKAHGGLPEFERPPVTEVAISVHFDEIGAFQPVHFGLLWTRLGNRYPRTEYHSPIGPTIELFDGQREGNVAIQFHSELPVGRCWYLNEKGTELLQLQPDRLTLNWRKLDTDAVYPRYSHIRTRFAEELAIVAGFMEEMKLGFVRPLQCELTYVNHIPQGHGWDTPADLDRVTTLWAGSTSDGFLSGPAEVRFAAQYLIEDETQPRGRLHVELHPAQRAVDKSRLVALHLVARGAPIGATMDGVFAFSDLAHEWVVRGFTSITTKSMHELWGRL
jgi:hypothetical protein